MRYTFPSFLLAAAILAVAFESASYIQSGSGAAYVTYEQAQPILKALEQVLPAELRHTNQRDAPSMWAKWVVHHDAQIRDRLAQGYEDSLTNFLLFGTSFTDSPRVTLAVLAQLANKPLQTTPNSFETGGVFELINARANDLVRAVASSSATSQLRDRTSAPVAEGPGAYRTLERSPSRDHRTRTRFHRQGRRIRFLSAANDSAFRHHRFAGANRPGENC